MDYESDGSARIRKIREAVGRPSRRVFAGVGEEAIITLPPATRLIATAETLVEGVHFDLTYMTARELGHKALAIPLSRQATQGAQPLYAMVSLGLTQGLSDPFVIELFRGMRELAKRFRVDIVSTQTVPSPTALMVNVTLIGQGSKRSFTRSGAREGDLIALTGHVGTSAAGLNCLKKLGRDALYDQEEIVKAHLSPEPRIKESLALLKSGGVTAMGHLSDSLSKEIYEVAERSEVGALLEESALPISPATVQAARLIDASPRAWALYGGEDYELLVTVAPHRLAEARSALKRLGKPLHVIGRITGKREGIRLRASDGETLPLSPRQWSHFVRRLKKR
jgi:thiamine-monophosphate kinase